MRKHGITILVALVAAVLAAGCFEESHHRSSDSSCSGGCGVYTPTEYDTWYTVEGPWTLKAGEFCGCDTGCGGYTEEQGVEDSIILDSNDSNIIDMELSYTVQNCGNFTTHAYVDVCDEFDGNCKTIFEGDLGPGDYYTDYAYTPAVDAILNDYLYCSTCGVHGYVHVYLGEQDVCTPVTLTYSYDGLYAEWY